MNSPWPMVKLGEVLLPVSRPELVDSSKTYRILGAHWYARGLYTKDIKLGSGVQAKWLYRVEEGDFVCNRLFAWKGSFALATTDNTGCYVSNEFPCFVMRSDRVDGRYLWRYFSRASAWEEALGLSTGGTPTSRNRLKEEKLLAMEIPLPPLAEQRRIVARIEELAAKTEEARDLRQQSVKDLDRVMALAEQRLWPTEALEGAPPLELLTTFLARGRQSEQGDSEHFLVKTQHVQMDRYVPTSRRLAPHVAAKVDQDAVLRDGDILIACSAAGCLGRVARYFGEGRVASTDTHVAIARANPSDVEPDYLYAYLRGSQGQHQLRSRERGDWQREKIGFRLTELNLSELKKVPVPLPTRSEQRRIVRELDALQVTVNTSKGLQAETAAELDALLPSILDRAFKGEP